MSGFKLMEIHRQRDPNVAHERFVTFQILQSSRAGPVDSLSPFLLDLNKKNITIFHIPSFLTIAVVLFLFLGLKGRGSRQEECTV